ncbi:hypothetical protein AG1IA_03955 [Rhizoctonia solani AG-1 IA]|uniref:Uncharacterized protein n=1 Tax=Thanatephorus cucumeris (strain AG1-IA) TaxID=983506 RepID=L8WV63_THACA|nr:hypothetical protein AG1IA_03955 [Rhizoctonia solani AG-1 IA]
MRFRHHGPIVLPPRISPPHTRFISESSIAWRPRNFNTIVPCWSLGAARQTHRRQQLTSSNIAHSRSDGVHAATKLHAFLSIIATRITKSGCDNSISHCDRPHGSQCLPPLFSVAVENKKTIWAAQAIKLLNKGILVSSVTGHSRLRIFTLPNLLITTHTYLTMDSAAVYSYSYPTEIEQPIDQETSNGGGTGSYCVIA